MTIFGKLTHTAAGLSLDSRNRPVCAGDIPHSIRSIKCPNEGIHVLDRSLLRALKGEITKRIKSYKYIFVDVT